MRGRVIGAKVVAALLVGLAAIVVAVGARRAGHGGRRRSDAWANIGVDDFAKFGLLQVSGILQGLAFGLLLLNSAAAIVAVLRAADRVQDHRARCGRALQDVAPWIDLAPPSSRCSAGRTSAARSGPSSPPLGDLDLLPFAVGLWRVLRAEVK